MEAKKTTAERLAEKNTTEALQENNGMDVTLHSVDEDGNAVCGATSVTGPNNVMAEQAAEHWCGDCLEGGN